MLILRRFLVLLVLSFWQGGFTFYASVVVPIGQQMLEHPSQGFVTRQVTVYLNLAGAVASVFLGWDLIAARDPSRWRRRGRWLLWAVMVVALVSLHWLHGRIDELLLPEDWIVREPKAFRSLHRLYLWISTVQWACGLLFLLFTLTAWRRADRTESA